MLAMVRGPNVTVASGQTDSNPLIMQLTFGDALYLAVVSPDTLPETASIQASLNFNVNYVDDGQTLAAAVSAASWDSVPAGAALGAAGAYVVFSVGLIVAAAIRIHLSGAAGADRTFVTYKQCETT